LLSFEVIT